MGKLSNEQKRILYSLEIARNKIARSIENGLITDDDIIKLGTKDSNYGITSYKEKKEKTLKTIFNYPYLLCDQDRLGIVSKKLLPLLLDYRYKLEIEELTSRFEEGSLSQKELDEYIKNITFIFYRSSKEGKEILKNGQVSSVKDNILRLYIR